MVKPTDHTQTPSKERGYNPYYFNTMAKVTYRGVSYDTNRHQPTVRKVRELIYRGIKRLVEVK